MHGIATFPCGDHYEAMIATRARDVRTFTSCFEFLKENDTSSWCTDYSYSFYRLKHSNSHSQSRAYGIAVQEVRGGAERGRIGGKCRNVSLTLVSCSTGL